MTRRLLVTYLSFALLTLVALEVPLGWVYQRGEHRHALNRLEHDAEVLAVFVDTALAAGRDEQVRLLARETAQRLGGQVEIVDEGGALRARTHHPADRPPVAAPAADLRAVLGGGGRISTGTARDRGVGVMSVAVPVRPGAAAQGALRVSVPTTGLDRRVRQFWWALGGVGATVLGVVALLAVALARWISRPVRALERATGGLADGVLPPPAVTGPPELRRLAASFHAAADRVQRLLDAQRSFVGHASHQLKTPLAALRLRLENLEPDVPPAAGRTLQAAIAETDRLAGLVESLLELARAEHDAPPREPVALGAAVAARVEHVAPLAAARGVRCTADGPAGTTVLALPGAVGQILDNLLANALAVAPPGSAVAVRWQRHGDAVALHVLDAGPGLPPEQRRRALDPFWRAPGARPGGTGLGLAVVRRLAEGGGGTAALHEAAGGGVDAVVVLPAA